MKKLFLVFFAVIALILASCGDGSSSSSSSGGSESDSDSTVWTLQSDGSWKSGGKILSGTAGAYMSEIKGGQPVKVNAINASNYTYENTSGTARTVIIKTTGGNLTINAPLDTVWHYGSAGTVNIIAVADSSYDGHANIATSLTVKKGHIKLTSDISSTIPLIDVPADASGDVDIEVPADVVVNTVNVASDQATNLAIAGEVSTVTVTGAATTVEVTGIVETVTGVAATVSGEGYIDDNNGGGSIGTAPYEVSGDTCKIKTTLGFKAFANEVNDGNDFSGKTVQLQNDIDLSKYANWTPVGKKGGAFFAGTFDGNGKAITGLNIEDVAGFADYMGLFGRIKDATVKNLTVSGNVTSTVDTAAGIVARMDGGAVQNCISNVIVAGVNKAGGIVALTNGPSIISDCINNGTVNADKNAGGILGLSNPGTQIRNCTNNASVAITTNENVGGILACAQANGATLDGDGIFNCTNNGAVTGKTDGSGLDRVGGVAGIIEHHSGSYTYTVSSCSNSGAVNGYTYPAGIIGIISTKVLVENSTNSGTITAWALDGSGHVSYPSGIVGSLNNTSTVSGCINSGTIVTKQTGSTYQIVGVNNGGTVN